MLQQLFRNLSVTSSSGARSMIFTRQFSDTMIRIHPIAFPSIQPLSLDSTSSRRGSSSKISNQLCKYLVPTQCVRAIETGWIQVVQLNGDATFGFCRADIDMIALGFCSFGGSNNPVCFSYIPHQSEGEILYTKTYFEMKSAIMAVFKAQTQKPCEFSIYI